MEQLSRELVHLGLSEKEAAVYVAALQLGPAPVQEIANKSEVNRATTYLAIEMLQKRGLLTSTEKDGRHIFVPEAPDRLLAILRLQKKELEEQELELTKVLPKLNAVFNRSGEKPEVRYLEGHAGVEMLRRHLEELPGEIVQIIGYDAFAKVIEIESTQEHRRVLKEKMTPVRALLVSDRAREDLQKQFSETMLDVLDFRVVAPSAFPFKVEGEITVQADRILMFTYATGPLAVEIRSAVLADTFRGIFELAWKK